MLTLTQCEDILTKAKAANAWSLGDRGAALHYLDKQDTEGFERVCRGNAQRRICRLIGYVFTDGAAEKWHDNLQLAKRSFYKQGRLVPALSESWYSDGTLLRKAKN